MEIRNVTWKGFEVFSMPAPKFAVEVLGIWDAIAWSHWKPVQVTFAGITQSTEKWNDEMVSHFNKAEKTEYKRFKTEFWAKRNK